VIEVHATLDIEPLLTTHEVAGWLRKHPRVLTDLAQRGLIPGAVKVGNSWRYDRREIERWLRGEGPARTEETD
jgi:hypothetical protein